MVSSGESWVLDGYPLVKLQKTMERSTMLLMGKLNYFEIRTYWCLVGNGWEWGRRKPIGRNRLDHDRRVFQSCKRYTLW